MSWYTALHGNHSLPFRSLTSLISLLFAFTITRSPLCSSRQEKSMAFTLVSDSDPASARSMFSFAAPE